MAFNKNPNNWIPGITVGFVGDPVEDEDSLVIPLSSIPELTPNEVTGPSADIRRVIFALSEAIYQSWNSKLTADRPVRMTLGRTTTTNDAAGLTNRNYNFAFNIEAANVEVANEPT